MNVLERANAVQELLRSSELSPEQVEALFEQARDRSYWRRVDPDCSIEGGAPATPVESDPLSGEEFARQLEQLQTQGYFKIEKLFDPALLERMRVCVERLRAERWPPVFTYVYDEFWHIVRSPSLRRLLTGFFGTGYRQNSNVWTYYVAAVTGASGWPPHSDSDDRDSTAHITTWIPLAEATADNGCMYVIPRGSIPATVPPHWCDITSITRDELRQMLQGTKALPAKPGAIMGWNHQLIHWGSIASGRTTPRISLGLEFTKDGTEPRPSELPMLDSVALPAFEERLMSIGKGLLDYGRFEPAVNRFRKLGARMWNDGRV